MRTKKDAMATMLPEDATLYDRLRLYVKLRNHTLKALARDLKLSASYFGVAKNQASIGSSVIHRISEYYPDLNLNWLITGKGVMINSDSASGKDVRLFADKEKTMLEIQQKSHLIQALSKELNVLISKYGKIR